MIIVDYFFTHIYLKQEKVSETESSVNMIILNKNQPDNVLVFTRFSFYLVNAPQKINCKEYNLLIENENNSLAALTIEAIKATDIYDIIYLKISDGRILVLTHAFDNYTGNSYQNLSVIDDKSKTMMTPLNVSEYDKFNSDFMEHNHFEVTDMRLI